MWTASVDLAKGALRKQYVYDSVIFGPRLARARSICSTTAYWKPVRCQDGPGVPLACPEPRSLAGNRGVPWTRRGASHQALHQVTELGSVIPSEFPS